jgi:hypothetical protein
MGGEVGGIQLLTPILQHLIFVGLSMFCGVFGGYFLYILNKKIKLISILFENGRNTA